MALAISHVVVGSDLSPGADAALRCGIAWALRHRLPLEIVHARSGLDDAARAAVVDALEARAADAGSAELPAKPLIRVEDGPPVTIPLLAHAQGGLLVVGAEGASSTLMRRAGAVTEWLADTREGPVLVAPPGWSRGSRTRRRAPPGSGLPARARSPVDPFQAIMVGLSGGRREADVLDAALEIAGLDRTLAFAHVVDLSRDRHLPPAARDAGRLRAEAERAAQARRLQDLALEAVPIERETRSPTAIHVVTQGPPDRDLAGLAAAQAMDLLIVGYGHVAVRLAGLSTVPLLVL